MINTEKHLPQRNQLCLIGEADQFMFLLLRRFVEKFGFIALHAQTGDSVLNLAKQEKPALIIIEPELPGSIRGWEAVQEIKSDRLDGNTPLVICSWRSETELQNLLAQPILLLQKPDLHFEDFQLVMQKAGFDYYSEIEAE